MTEAPVPFAMPVAEETLQRVAERLREHNIKAIVVDDGEAARALVLERVPKGAEVYTGKSKTLQDAGIEKALQAEGEYDALRPRYLKMDRKTQMREIRKLIGAPDYVLASVQAITEDGVLAMASATANQIGPISNTAGKGILVVGAQKIVPDLDAALLRMGDCRLRLEGESRRKAVH